MKYFTDNYKNVYEVWGLNPELKKCTSMCLQFGTSSDGKEVAKELQLYK
jgi:hypothetical protein